MSEGDSPVKIESLRDRVSLRVAAKLAGTRYGYIKGLVDRGKLDAWRQGRAILVRPGDIGPAVLEDQRYVPTRPATPRPRPAARASHQDVHF